MNARTITLLLALALAAHVHGQEAEAESTTMELTCKIATTQWQYCESPSRCNVGNYPGRPWPWEPQRTTCSLGLQGAPVLVHTNMADFDEVVSGDQPDGGFGPPLGCGRFDNAPHFVRAAEGIAIVYDKAARTISRCFWWARGTWATAVPCGMWGSVWPQTASCTAAPNASIQRRGDAALPIGTWTAWNL